MLGEVAEKLGQFMIGSWIKTAPGSDDAVWDALIRNFDSLATGSVYGQEVARSGRRSYKFILLVAKADEEARCNTFGLPH